MGTRERGNVFFYIFLAIALFGALSFAVSQGSRGTIQNLTSEQVRLRASEILDYGDTIAKTVGLLRLRGTAAAQLRFSNTVDSAYGTPGTDPEQEVFNTGGGGGVYRLPQDEALDGTAGVHYGFYWNIAVADIGTTCAAAACADLLLALPHVSQSVCLEINTLLDVDNPSGAPPDDSGATLTTPYTGTIGYTDTIGDESGSAALKGRTAGCFRDTGAGQYVYYRVLWSQ